MCASARRKLRDVLRLKCVMERSTRVQTTCFHTYSLRRRILSSQMVGKNNTNALRKEPTDRLRTRGGLKSMLRTEMHICPQRILPNTKRQRLVKIFRMLYLCKI